MSVSHCAEFVAHSFAVYFDHLTPDSSAHHPNVVMVHGGSHTGSCYLITAEGKPGWAYRFAERGYRVAVPDWARPRSQWCSQPADAHRRAGLPEPGCADIGPQRT